MMRLIILFIYIAQIWTLLFIRMDSAISLDTFILANGIAGIIFILMHIREDML